MNKFVFTVIAESDKDIYFGLHLIHDLLLYKTFFQPLVVINAI